MRSSIGLILSVKKCSTRGVLQGNCIKCIIFATYKNHISAAAKADYARWKDEPTPYGGQPMADNTDMDKRSLDVVNHLRNKIGWF